MANPKARRRRKIIVFSCILLGLVGLTLAVVLRKQEPEIAVETDKVTRRDITETVMANGRIQPVVQVKISAEVSGEIIEMPVKEGQAVKKGDLLVRIKPDTYLANKRSAEASYQSARSGLALSQANARKAELEFKRNEQLYQTKLISESQNLEYQTGLEIAQAQVRSSEHQVSVAKASLDRVEEELAKTTINSPITGTVSKLNLEVGERVAGNTMMAGTEIMTLADLNQMEARVDIGENDIVLIQKGQSAILEVDSFRDRKFKGTVTEIANSAKGSGSAAASGQDATRFEVRIHIDESEAFRPGMSITAEVSTRSRTNVLTVPVQSVTTRLPKPEGTNAATSANSGTTNTTAATKSAATNTTAIATGSNTTTSGTNSAIAKSGSKKPGEQPKAVEVVFLLDGDRAKMVTVKRGINDEAWAEIETGLTEGQEIISGGFKAVSRELEDGKKVRKQKVGFGKDALAKGKEGEK
jgi:HlyD family secretion protein